MSARDGIALLCSYLYAGGLLALAEAVRRWRNYPHDFTRKLVHIGAGMWVFGVLALFETWYIGLIPFATFIGINYLLYRYRFLSAIDAPDSSPGTVYFAFSITVLFAIFWRTDGSVDRAAIAAAGAMAMTWGDAMASIIGQRFGRHQYTLFGSTRSWEGSAALVVAAWLAIFLTLVFVPGSPLSPNGLPYSLGLAALAALLAALGSAAVESISPSGTDNLSVPFFAAVIIVVTTAFAS